MFAPLAKWVTQIDYAKRIPEVVAHAVDVATSGRPGPVVIALSEEMQKDQVQVPDLPRATVSPAFPDPDALQKMRSMLAKSRKPLAVVGGSCWTDAGPRRPAQIPATEQYAGHGRLPPPVALRRHLGQFRR